MGGVQSGRTRNVARDIRSTLARYRGQSIPGVRETDEQAAEYLAANKK